MSKTNPQHSQAWPTADPFRRPDEAAAPVGAVGTRLLCAAGLTALLGWLYLPVFAELADKWLHDPGYSHGILVPFFSLYLAWRRKAGRPLASAGGAGLGYALIALAVGVRLTGGVFASDWADAVSLLPALAGVTVLLGGMAALRWLGPTILFLVFMIPLPYRLEIALGYPLQRIATLGSTFLLQTLGLPALSEGNTILINDLRLGVVEACSGLRMLVTFFAFSTAVATLSDRRLADKLLIVLSAIPIALAVNIVRITATGVAYVYIDGKLAHHLFHDLAGWFMMPLCLACLGVELWWLRRLFVDAGPDRPALPLLARA